MCQPHVVFFGQMFRLLEGMSASNGYYLIGMIGLSLDMQFSCVQLIQPLTPHKHGLLFYTTWQHRTIVEEKPKDRTTEVL